MKVRIVSPGFETYTGSLGHRCVFEDGVSVTDLDQRAINRIGSGLQIIDIETGQQVGPGAAHANLSNVPAPIAVELQTKSELDAENEANAVAEREKLAAEEKVRKATEAVELEKAKAKAEADAAGVIYTRQELEAVGANDGVEGLRAIATPLGVKGRSITELVDKILEAQAKAAA